VNRDYSFLGEKGKGIKKNQQNFRDLQSTTKLAGIQIMRVLENNEDEGRLKPS
jgi:hypothetical protein